jgi:hypothetical protein
LSSIAPDAAVAALSGSLVSRTPLSPQARGL